MAVPDGFHGRVLNTDVRKPPHNIWLRAALAFTAVAALVSLYLLGVELTGVMPRCLFRDITGWSCPGCGSQRALASLLEGHIAEAVSHNYILPAALAYLSLCGMHWIFPANNTISKIYRRITTPRALIAVALAMLAWMAVRNIAGC